MDLFEQLTSLENLNWAWGKVRRYYQTTDAWFNEAEVATFEASLEGELSKIRDQFRIKAYRTSPILPLAHPKAPDDHGKPRARQAFWVSVADQVAWIAFVNVIGPQMEARMPVWSYGNRLYRPAWFEDCDDHRVLKIGPFRHSPGLLYRKFQHSWPLYRRHIYLTVRQMSSPKHWKNMPLAEADAKALDAEDRLDDPNRVPYLKPGFWKKPVEAPFWASLDLEKFYPSVRVACVKENIRENCAEAPDLCGSLLDDLLHFPLDLSGWTVSELGTLGLDSGQVAYEHIPTGLMAAGFLANVAMQKLDDAVSERAEEAQIAHFRYVDDHVVLARTFDDLENWIRRYRLLLAKHRIGPAFNPEKFEPAEFGQYFSARSGENDVSELKKEAIRKCRLDPKFPAPLMTKTLGKISELGRTDFNLLDDREQEAALSDLEHLLVTEFPDTELPAQTRVTFAATKIAFLAASREQSVARLTELERERLHLVGRGSDIRDRLKNSSPRSRVAEQLRTDHKAVSFRDRLLVREITELRKQHSAARGREVSGVFALLVKAVHEYPEKLRLWERVLEFCRIAGHAQFEPLIEEFYLQLRVNPLAGRLLRARVLQSLAGQMLRCARVIASDEYPPKQRTAASLFLVSILKWSGRLFKGRQPKYYEREAEFLCRAAAGTCLEVLTEAEANGHLTKVQLRSMSEGTRSLGAINWRQNPEEWAGRSGHSLTTWVWWAEGQTQSPLAISPGPIWRIMADQLDPRDAATWALWSRYPESVSDAMRRTILRPGRRPALQDESWLLDLPPDSGGRSLPSVWNQRMRKLFPSMESYLDLRTWTVRTEDLYRTNPFDPRTGEWTALRIVQQVLTTMIHSGSEVPLHWSTVMVPEVWSTYDGARLRWDQWHRALVDSSATLRTTVLLDDFQEMRNTLHHVGSDPAFARVQEAGLLLLGLLRRSFRWPAAWRSPGMLAEAGWVTRATIHDAQASSWTTGILEACLLPRQRETVLLSALFFDHLHWDDDTISDPPSISSLRTLSRYVGRAIQVLESGQITVRDHLPRQLVPVRVEQISRKEWDISITTGPQNEDDDE